MQYRQNHTKSFCFLLRTFYGVWQANNQSIFGIPFLLLNARLTGFLVKRLFPVMATYCPLGRLLRKVRTSPQSARQSPTAAAISERFGEKISTNPFPFTSAEKLETQKGIKKSLN